MIGYVSSFTFITKAINYTS